MGRRPGSNYDRLRWHRNSQGYYAQDSVTHRHFIVVKAGKVWELKEARENAIGVFDHIIYMASAGDLKRHCRSQVLGPLTSRDLTPPD